MRFSRQEYWSGLPFPFPTVSTQSPKSRLPGLSTDSQCLSLQITCLHDPIPNNLLQGIQVLSPHQREGQCSDIPWRPPWSRVCFKTDTMLRSSHPKSWSLVSAWRKASCTSVGSVREQMWYQIHTIASPAKHSCIQRVSRAPHLTTAVSPKHRKLDLIEPSFFLGKSSSNTVPYFGQINFCNHKSFNQILLIILLNSVCTTL